MKQLSIFMENKPGRLAEITTLLGERNVNIRALSLADTETFGVLRIIVEQPEAVLEHLKEHGVTASLTDVLAVSVSDQPGGLAKALSLLGEQGIQVEYMYAFVSAQKADEAMVVMRVQDLGKAQEILTQGGYGA